MLIYATSVCYPGANNYFNWLGQLRALITITRCKDLQFTPFPTEKKLQFLKHFLSSYPLSVYTERIALISTSLQVYCGGRIRTCSVNFQNKYDTFVICIIFVSSTYLYNYVNNHFLMYIIYVKSKPTLS